MLTLGFMGSLHCVGMCGGLISAVSMSRPHIWWNGLGIYQAGRITTYSLLGILAGLSGLALGAGDLPQRMLAILAGSLMIIFALNLAGWLPDPLRRLSSWASRKTGLATLARNAAAQARAGSWFMLGLANGLLPCGLVYAALSLALAATSAADAGLMMMSFGLGTVPAMMLLPSTLHKMSAKLRQSSLRIAAILIIIMGIVTIMRSQMSLLH